MIFAIGCASCCASASDNAKIEKSGRLAIIPDIAIISALICSLENVVGLTAFFFRLRFVAVDFGSGVGTAVFTSTNPTASVLLTSAVSAPARPALFLPVSVLPVSAAPVPVS